MGTPFFLRPEIKSLICTFFSQVSSSHKKASSSEHCCFQNKNKTMTGSPESMKMLDATHMLTVQRTTVWPIYNGINILEKGCAWRA
jgi:hypothetical protein